MPYIKIGDRIFNPDQLCSATIDTDEQGQTVVTLFFSDQDNFDCFYGAEAQLLWDTITSLSSTPADLGVAA